MYSASLIAYVFVLRGIKEANYITQLKLQKMVYFANGYHLAKFGRPLVKEPFEAWKFGPVIPQIYSDYKLYGNQPIVDVAFYNEPKRKELEAMINSLDEEAKQSIDYTWEATKDVSAVQLSSWTHQKDSPWDKSFKSAYFSTTSSIDNNEIKSYFQNFLSADS